MHGNTGTWLCKSLSNSRLPAQDAEANRQQASACARCGGDSTTTFLQDAVQHHCKGDKRRVYVGDAPAREMQVTTIEGPPTASHQTA